MLLLTVFLSNGEVDIVKHWKCKDTNQVKWYLRVLPNVHRSFKVIRSIINDAASTTPTQNTQRKITQIKKPKKYCQWSEAYLMAMARFPAHFMGGEL